MTTEPLRVAVVGSVNLDRVARVTRFPRPGETLTGATLSHHPGGKGANQAVAARRLGTEVWLVACVGDDTAANEALENLRAEGVHLDLCRALPGEATGQALILVDDQGENQIVVAPGANARFVPDLLDLPAVDCVIAQLEVPGETLLEAARRHRGLFCLNAAPVRPVASELLALTGLLVVNEGEAEALAEVLGGYQGLLAITHGARGAELRQGDRVIATATPPKVDAIDTVGAGDAFTAALAVGIASGLDHGIALKRACIAGALATTRPGAQSSPTLAELNTDR